MDIQHIMDYLPTTYVLQQQDVSKTIVDLKLLREIPIDSSVNQCQGFCYNSKKMYLCWPVLILKILDKLYMS